MKILIAYSSLSGNTKYLANELYKGLSIIKDELGCQFEIRDIKNLLAIPKEAQKLVEDSDVILCGFWIDKGNANEEAANFMARIEGKKVGVFATLTADPKRPRSIRALKKGTSNLFGSFKEVEIPVEKRKQGQDTIKIEFNEPQKNQLIFSYICQGRLSFEQKMTSLLRDPDHPHAVNEERMNRWAKADSHPDSNDVLRLIKFCVDSIKKLK